MATNQRATNNAAHHSEKDPLSLGIIVDGADRSVDGEVVRDLISKSSQSVAEFSRTLNFPRTALYQDVVRIRNRDVWRKLFYLDVIFYRVSKGRKSRDYAMKWLFSKNPQFLNFTPFEAILAGNGPHIAAEMAIEHPQLAADGEYLG